MFSILTGFESTCIVGSGRDVFDLTRHTELYRSDLELVREAGITSLRYSVPWHSIERKRGVYDWGWMDGVMAAMRDLGLDPIVDPLHHTSFPVWLEAGFANPDFPEKYEAFVAAFAERYPWVTKYTIINEFFVTAWFCGHEAIWCPYYQGDDSFVPMVVNMGKAVCNISAMLIETVPGVQIIHVDACEQHRAMDRASEVSVAFRNELRFLVPDLILGRIDSSHPLYEYLTENGMTQEEVEWFQSHSSRIDVMGLDYYAHCELEWNKKGRVWPNQFPRGFAAVARDYVERYGLPVMLSETNTRGFITDRISWLKFTLEQCEKLALELSAQGIEFKGYCWYPFVDSTDWCSLVKKAEGRVDPQGIYWLDAGVPWMDQRRKVRHASELSEIFAQLAQGKITSEEIPAYPFQPPLTEALSGFMPLMNHWEWKALGGVEIPKKNSGAGKVFRPANGRRYQSAG